MKKTFLPFGTLFFLITLLSPLEAVAQEEEIQWLSFEQLEDSLAIKPKKVFIDFYADWCAYCKKMDKAAFKDKKAISLLNSEYYAVKMNAETTETIAFGGDIYTNKEVGKKRNPTHQIPLLLASRENRPFSLPAIIVFNERFEIIARYFEYLSPKKLNGILSSQ
ncbi:thioredoxin family protein [Flagellimonas meridianipacifica]|uniref:Thioredoxin-like protein n=1 Tax=Flagellimonas meridianipacifica TaxID=1080225 RepID=A0A2T0MHT7_9FLAO|nr:thioredoxin fold domain-containing protein [Allomuricauda pacifica]PRX57143.1 thioredoxin-like protein [Allomuricauda pacifica]